MSSRPKFVEVIENRGESVTARNARIQREQEARLLRQQHEAKLREARQARCDRADAAGEQKWSEMQERLQKSGLVDLVTQAVVAFGKIEDDEGIERYMPDTPKKVGAWQSRHGYWAWDYERDLDKPETEAVVRLAIESRFINYLTRDRRSRRQTYVLSRYAILMAEGGMTEDKPVVHHGELPQLTTDINSARSWSFGTSLQSSMDNQLNNLIEWDQTAARVVPTDFVPRIVREALPFDPDNPQPILSAVEDGIAEFAKRRFVPIAEQPIF